MTEHVAKFAKFASMYLRRVGTLEIRDWKGRPAVWAGLPRARYVVFIARDMRELHQAVMATLEDVSSEQPITP